MSAPRDLAGTSRAGESADDLAVARSLSPVAWLALGVPVLVAVVLAVTSLSYPHGRDQATHAYIGLRWLEGAVPYRDTFDIKAPGVFFAHVVAFTLFGRNMAAIHALDLVASVLPASVLVALATCHPGAALAEKARHTLRVAPAYALLYYGTFEYGGTAQSETWCNVVAATALYAATAAPARAMRASFVLGICAGAALVFKPPSVLVPAVCSLHLLLGARGGTLRATAARVARLLGAHALGAAVVLAPVLAYFYRTNALAPMYDVVVVTTARYASAGGTALSAGDSIGELLMALSTFHGVPLFVAAVAVVRSRAPEVNEGLRTRYRLGAWVAVAATLVVVAQRKFFLYHWVVLVPPLVFLAGVALSDLRRATAEPAPAPWAEREVLLTALVLVATLGGGDGTAGALRGLAQASTYAKTGAPSAFDAAYEEPGFYGLAEYREVADAVAHHTEPGENVLVRGFEPQLYLLADRRYEGRHFWSYFVSGSVFAQPERFRAEDWGAFVARPPKVVVAFTADHEAISSASTYEKMGYHAVARSAAFSVLLRDGELTLPAECPW